MSNKLSIALLIGFTIALGFLRDYVFVSINYFIDSGNDISGRLVLLKWILTLLFSVLYFLDTIAFLYVLFYEKKYTWLAAYSYGLLFAVAVLSAAAGYIFTSFEVVYPFIRMVLGVAQSPVVVMVLVPACYLDRKIKNN